jgi:hypothetical protein
MPTSALITDTATARKMTGLPEIGRRATVVRVIGPREIVPRAPVPQAIAVRAAAIREVNAIMRVMAADRSASRNSADAPGEISKLSCLS